MIIDIAAHYIPEPIQEMFSTNPHYIRGATFPFPAGNADIENRLGIMEKHGISMQALLAHTWNSPPVVRAFSRDDLQRMRQISNQENAALCKQYPNKFVNICAFSLVAMDQAMDELKRCVEELDARAVTVATNQEGQGLDSDKYFPFYEKLVERDLPLYLHPTNWEGCYPLVDMQTGWRMMHVFGWPFDTTQAIWRLIFGGVFDRFPKLKVITHHLGGMFPYFSRRVEINVKKFLADALPKPFHEYLLNVYGDTALDGTAAAYPCGYALFGPDRMVFGTDYPYGLEDGEDFIRENLKGVQALDIPEDALEKITSGNAMRLLKIGSPTNT